MEKSGVGIPLPLVQEMFDEMPEIVIDSVYSDDGPTFVVTFSDTLRPVYEEILHQVFERFGTVESVDFVPRRTTSKHW